MKTIIARCIASLMLGALISFGPAFAQSAASVTWNLTAPDSIHVSTLSGNISSPDQAFSNLYVPASGGYPAGVGQRTSAKDAGSDGSWPGEAAEVASRYMQFKVGPQASNDLSVTNVSAYLWVNSGSNMRANVYYSTDSTFATRTQIGTTFTLSSTAPGSPNVTATPGVSVPSGSAFYLRIYPWYTTSTTGKYVVTKIVTISGTTTPTGNFISTSVASLSSFSHVVGTPSTTQSYTVSGTTLSNNVVVTPPLNFEISTDAGSTWHGNSSPVTLTVSGGSIVGQPVTITARLNGAAASPYSGNIAHTSVSAAEKDVAVDGTTLATEPSTQSAISIGTVTTSTIDVNFTGGNGSRRIVVARPSSAVNWAPADGIPPGGVSNNYSTATDQGSGNKIVYDGTGSTVSVIGLSSSTTYHFAVYEYNTGTGNSQNYKSTSPGTGNATTQAATSISVAPGTLTFGGVEINTVSAEQTYSLSGTLLTPSSGNITVAAPSGYRVSATSGSGFDTLIQVPYSGGTLGATTIYVRFQPTAVQSYNANIQNSGGGATTQNVAVTGSGSAPSAPNEFQAEDGILSSAYVRNQYAGYTGTGYVDIANKTGASLEFLFRRATAVSDTVRFYYALGGATRAYAVSLNGASLGNLSFTTTGSWTTWSSVTMVIALQAGVNRLNLAATTNSSDNANLDKIVVGGQSATAVFRLVLTKSGPGSAAAAPPSSDSLYDVGTTVTLTATPSGGNILHHWSGSEESTSNPLIVTMTAHKTEIAVMTPPSGFGAFPYHPSADGFASVDAFGYSYGTTGGSGAGSQRVYVSNYAEFADLTLRRVDPTHALNFPPLTVIVMGTISGTDMIDVKDLYDVTIIGAGVDAKLSGFGLNIVRAHNVIVRNLLIENSSIDGVTIQGDDIEGTTDHIWIDHCSVTNAYDGAIDVSHTASYVTISWNHIFHHDKACLMGHSDTQTSDVAMKVTYHHNFFDSTTQRHPRVRYGKAHVYNNYFYKNGLYGVSSNLEADVVVEGSYFLNVPIPTETSRDASPPGDLVQRYNIFAGTTGAAGTRGTAFDPSTFYSYSIDSASTIPATVSSYSGSGKYDFASSAALPPVYTITLNASHGSIGKNPDQPTYDSAATVQLTATPATGYHFVNWTGDLTGSSNPQNILMNANRNVTANFAIDQFTITASSGSNGSIAPSGAVNVNYGDSVQFTFTPSGGYHLDSVIVDGSNQGTPSSYTFYSVQANHTIRSVFAQNPAGQYTLTVAATHGSVSKNPDQAFYPSGTMVHLTAIPATGYHFTSWSGSLVSSSNPDSIVMNSDKAVTANFTLNQYTANITVVGNGSVAKNPDQSLYDHGTNLQLTATPSGGWLFNGWSGDASGATNPLTVAMTGVKNITATFVTAGNAVFTNGTGGGSWSAPATWQGGMVPLATDSVVVLGTDSVTVSTGSACADFISNAGSRVALYAQLSAMNVLLSGTMIVYADTMKVAGQMIVSGTGIYNQAQNGGSLPIAMWNPGSVLNITGVVANAPSNGNQNFYNILWDCAGQTANVNLGWDSITVGGNITVINTGVGRWQLTAPAAGDSAWVVVNGDIVMSGGQLTSNGTSNGNTKIIIDQYGNVDVTGGNFSVSRGSQGSGTGSTRWNLHNGNFTMSNATTQNSNPANARFVFSKPGTQTLTLGSGNTITALPFEVSAGTTLNLGSSVVGGSGVVMIDAGATLQCALAGGLDAALNGSGTKTFSTASSYTFNGAAAQVTGDAMPDTLANLTINNPNGVTLSDSILVDGTLTLTNGDLVMGGKTVTLGASGALLESAGNTAIGKIFVTRTMTQGNDQSFGGIGLTLNAAGASPGSTSVTRITGVAQTGGSYTSILRSFDISPSTNTGLDARVDYFYDDSELAAQDAATLQLWKSTDAGVTWNAASSSPNPGLHRVRAVGVGSLSRFAASDASHPLGAAGHLYSYQDKWNMVSLSLAVADARTAVLFPAAVSRLYEYDHAYVMKDTLAPGIGYWLKFNGAQNVSITGVPTQHDTADIAVGWNMIGSVSDSAAVGTAQVEEIPPGLAISHYFGYSGVYISTTSLHAGKAYWVKSNSAGKIVLNSTLAVAAPKIAVVNPLSNFSKLTITDVLGNTQVLYVGKAGQGAASSEYELPPVPPAALFDVRFASQRYVEIYPAKIPAEERYPLALQSAEYPVTVSWEILDGAKMFSLLDRQNGKRVSLSGTGSVVFEKTSTALTLTINDWTELPTDYSLGPNYPNPFNPSTSFKVGMPRNGQVSIGIYNLLGQKIRSLLDQEQPAGYFTVEWNGQTDDHRIAGSGVYFVRMESESFVAVQKIIMLK